MACFDREWPVLKLWPDLISARLMPSGGHPPHQLAASFILARAKSLAASKACARFIRSGRTRLDVIPMAI
jgi:hypothetical protein